MIGLIGLMLEKSLSGVPYIKMNVAKKSDVKNSF